MQPLTFDFGTTGNGDQKDIQTDALIKMLSGGGMQQQNPRAGAMGGINSAVQAMLPMLMMRQKPLLSTPIPQANPALTGAGDLPMVG